MAYQNDRITSIPAPLPKDYDRGFSFTDYQTINPGDPLPGAQLDNEFANIEQALDETQARARLIQRDDGALANGSVGLDQLAAEIYNDIDGVGVIQTTGVSSLNTFDTTELVNFQQFSVKDGNKIRRFHWDAGADDFVEDKSYALQYQTTDELQAADLQADASDPTYARVADKGHALYKITSDAATALDITLSNGNTATRVYEETAVVPLSDITALSSLNTAALTDGQQFSVKDGDKIRLFAWNAGTESFDEMPVVTDTGTEMDQVPLNTNIVYPLSDITALGALSAAALVDGQQFSVGSYLPDTSTGSCLLRWRPDLPKSRHDGVLFFSLTVPMFTGTDTTDYRNGAGESDSDGNGVMELVRGEIIYDATVPIPTLYDDLQSAVDDLNGRIRVKPGVMIKTVWESGHMPTGGISVSNGDYGHFLISSEDAEVVAAGDFSIVAVNARAPVLDTIVDLTNSTAFDSYKLENVSRGLINSGAGMRNGTRGLHATNRSDCSADGSVFTGFVQAGLHCSRSSEVQCSNAVFDDNSTGGGSFGAVYASRNSRIHGQSVSIQNSGSSAIRAQRFAKVALPEVNVSGSAGACFHATLGGEIYCTSGPFTANNISSEAVICQEGRVIVEGEFDNTSGFSGISVECRTGVVSVSGQINGYSGTVLYATQSGVINARGVTISSGGTGISAEQGGRVSARSVTITNMTGSGAFANRGGFIEVVDGTITGSGSNDLAIQFGSTICAKGCTTTNGAGNPDVGDTNISTLNAIASNNGIIWA